MAYIFLDESGDLGFNFKKRGTSNFFVITLLFIEGSKGPIEKIIKKTHSQLAKKFKRRIGVLHAVYEKPVTRQRILKGIAKKDCLVMTIYLNKKKVFTNLQDEKQVLYNYVTNILLDRIYVKKIISSDKSIELIASRRETNKFLNENFKDYLRRQVKSIHKGTIQISIKTPAEEKCLQATDFLSWAFFRKYEKGDDSYYNIFNGKIVEESSLFP
ncbi:hypothetical protein A3H65_03465 [Candidatus Giovannonibacteria bacterium RIFCSPLOWO2_02_FULL_45_14]|uniref:DUF3800 domain-containing protein n=1 Tax=Candidatus Giovannonibacteria bacterium RIFCSPLOWO2_12_FULL_44_15 TaxID=1798364 RepID=A0A1F5Y0D7_9BACT|nr:MAG: hypothetical protein A3C75_01770 [Candidatus Giovannonibacteria bacterium RIFCSPHIGHO2_02_FULL_44_31]OGF77147.1 MAG: hypothetical protein A3E62_00170 [Candidatus Giovannonibacteria bacterium RIFCSPHIGHO2_12_FULL_44_29]OGF90694.1 MAG: hypothetical protein A3H65_03465 [Candidatus Giovannonibacteria bacterium RIFCSPLOWO2_02_FULL_45_14]OGF93552.1 MAG: hypothetical protein A3G54_01250 [Candidatus Giovannonibacteria bacterium RIFCSPLOWO2_12_FULL_44_15]